MLKIKRYRTDENYFKYMQLYSEVCEQGVHYSFFYDFCIEDMTEDEILITNKMNGLERFIECLKIYIENKQEKINNIKEEISTANVILKNIRKTHRR